MEPRIEPPDNTTANSREYMNSMTSKAQTDACLEFMDAKNLYANFDAYAFERITKEHPEWIRAYCESLDSFWDYVG